jgi:enoyl-CoA hydratase/carnithine racemase
LCRVLADEAVKVIVLTGAGQFAAGADVRELAALRACAVGQDYAARGQALCALIEESPKPVIAALNGRYVLGGGVEIALACHLRLMEEGTRLASPEVQLGISVGWGASQRLPRLVGPARALELLLTGKRLSAAEAERIGLVNRVVPDSEALREAVALAREIAAFSAPALAAVLRCVYTGLREGFAQGMRTEAEMFGLVCAGEDAAEGTQAFLEKRRPVFRDR